MAQPARQKIKAILENGCCCGGETATLRQRRNRGFSAGNAVNVHLQCDKCGASLSGAMKRAEHYFFQDYSEWDSDLKERQFEIRRGDVDEAEQVRFQAYENRKTWYREVFLKSAEWRDVRARVMRRANGICEACLDCAAEQVHHDGYENGSLPPMWQLRAICRVCHEKVTHGWPMEKLSEFSETQR